MVEFPSVVEDPQQLTKYAETEVIPSLEPTSADRATPPLPSSPRAAMVSNKDGPTDDANAAPPLPDEPLPPLPNEPMPETNFQQQQPLLKTTHDDGWEPVWDDSAQSFYFYNRFTQKTQWENPRVPTVPGATIGHGETDSVTAKGTGTVVAGGYNPSIHGDYDPNADYAQRDKEEDEQQGPQALNADGTPAAVSDVYAATANFNRFTGRFQGGELRPENFNDENKSRRQMNAFFDVDAAANTHAGKSLKKERQERKLTRDEVKAFREKKKDKKEQKRRAWLRD